MRAFKGALGQVIPGKGADRVLEQTLFFGEFEIHGGLYTIVVSELEEGGCASEHYILKPPSRSSDCGRGRFIARSGHSLSV